MARQFLFNPKRSGRGRIGNQVIDEPGFTDEIKKMHEISSAPKAFYFAAYSCRTVSTMSNAAVGLPARFASARIPCKRVGSLNSATVAAGTVSKLRN